MRSPGIHGRVRDGSLYLVVSVAFQSRLYGTYILVVQIHGVGLMGVSMVVKDIY